MGTFQCPRSSKVAGSHDITIDKVARYNINRYYSHKVLCVHVRIAYVKRKPAQTTASLTLTLRNFCTHLF